jgi:hypothetical protein
MLQAVEIENIEELRRQAGIEDRELWEHIRQLRVGDYVKLTFLTIGRQGAGTTCLVRITSVDAAGYRGQLAEGSTVTGNAKLRAGSVVAFKNAHIHSVPKRQKQLT